MANWASTNYYIEGSKEDLKKIYDVIDGFMTKKIKPKDGKADKGWEGNILITLGATEEQMKGKYLRGFIQDYNLGEDYLQIYAKEAWGLSEFRDVLNMLIPNLKIYYCVEELEGEVFATNDNGGKYFYDTIIVDCCIDRDYRHEYFSTKEEAIKYIARQLKKEEITEEEIEKWREKNKNTNGFIYIHEIKYVE